MELHIPKGICLSKHLVMLIKQEIPMTDNLQHVWLFSWDPIQFLVSIIHRSWVRSYVYHCCWTWLDSTIIDFFLFLHVSISMPPGAFFFLFFLFFFVTIFQSYSTPKDQTHQDWCAFSPRKGCQEQAHSAICFTKQTFCTDILTKGLSSTLFRIHCFNHMLGSTNHKIEGAC